MVSVTQTVPLHKLLLMSPKGHSSPTGRGWGWFRNDGSAHQGDSKCLIHVQPHSSICHKTQKERAAVMYKVMCFFQKCFMKCCTEGFTLELPLHHRKWHLINLCVLLNRMINWFLILEEGGILLQVCILPHYCCDLITTENSVHILPGNAQRLQSNTN